ncbi:MAG: diguanylate cyclase [Spirochaetales bacterium]|nr:diguanylate cyclase [Spirochaetales bacterium]
MNPKILIVEDSDFYGNILIRSLTHLNYETVWCKSYGEAQSVMDRLQNIFIALLDFHLPDALNGEIIDLCLDHSIPSIVMTGSFSPDLQEFVWSKRVIDYVLKEGGHSIQYLVGMVERIIKNRTTGVLIVDDSLVSRKHLNQLLTTHQYKIYEAEDCKTGLKLLDDHSDIKLVLTDYQMPGCDGFEFTKKIRKRYPLDKLAIIGISSTGNHLMMTKFLKYGANDFLTKPFVSELLYSRINQNIKIIEMFDIFREASLRDDLTGIHNRRYLNEAGEVLFNSAVRNNSPLAVAMVDLDKFKRINDTMGHEMGDLVLKKIASNLKDHTRKSDIISRYGGEEFCIISSNLDSENIETFYEKLRLSVSEIPFSFEDKTFRVTVSIGVCLEKQKTLYEMINVADGKLYEAKEQGRNRVCL